MARPERINPRTVLTKLSPKFPCDNEKNSYRGTLLQKWTYFKVFYDRQHPTDTPLALFVTSSNFDQDAILTVTDVENQAEHWTIKLDRELLGETEENSLIGVFYKIPKNMYCVRSSAQLIE